MTNEAKQLYLERVKLRYKKSTKKEKTRILDEFHQSYGCSRHHAKRILGRRGSSRLSHRGRKAKYDKQIIPHLVRLWRVMGRMCSVRLKAALPLWLSYDESVGLTDDFKAQLISLSPSTIDRYLRPYRDRWKRGLSGTEPSAIMKSMIPVELIKKVKEPGFMEADTVMHCGNSMRGEFAVSLTMTDIHSTWTENRACWGKDSKDILQKIKEIRGSLPFTLKGFASDNGSEFLSKILVQYFRDKKYGTVKFTRSRPYRKNDAAHVEQKNHTHVRQLFGYSRLDNRHLVLLMNDIYQSYWNPLTNFFCPSMKVVRKVRIGGKIRRKYDKPRTPYERLLESEKLTELQKEHLKLTMEALNPIQLRMNLEKKLRHFHQRLTQEQVMGGPCELNESA